MEDLDFLYSTARVRAMEKNLLNREKLERMCQAKTMEEAAKVLSESGWEQTDFSGYEAMEQTLSAERKAALDTAMSIAPNKSLVAVFLLKYDYHNLKVILKAERKGEDPAPNLSDVGTIQAKTMLALVRENDLASFSPAMRKALSEAKDVLARTHDPQFADIALDRGCYEEMLSMAKASGSEFLSGYISLLIDCINLRTAVRLKKMGRPYDYLKQCFLSGGSVALGRLLADMTPDHLDNVYAKTPLKEAAAAGGAALRGDGRLSALDMKCDNALMHYLHRAKYIGLGEQPLLGYVAAKEAEILAVHTVMACRLANLSPETITERLRDSYV